MVTGCRESAAPPFGVLAEVLADWVPIYQRWRQHPFRPPDAVLPWSAADQARLDRLADVDSGTMAASADRLARVATGLEEIGRAVAEVGERGGVGAAAARRCGELAAVIRDRAGEAGALAHDLRAAAARVEHLVAEVLAELGRLADTLGDARSARYLGLRDGEAGTARLADDRDWSALTELVGRHAQALAPLRAVVTEVDAGDAWCSASAGPGESGDDGTWESGWPAPAAEVGRDEADQVWRVWQPLPDPDASVAAGRPITPGSGPLMPGTEGARPDTDLGVRIARLPDAPGSGRGRAGP
jgi:hypothetical protein